MQPITNSLKNHFFVKPVLLELIENFKEKHNTLLSSDYNTVHSDWQFLNEHRPHIDEFYKHIEETILNVGRSIHLNMFGNCEWNMHYAWFQQYYEDGTHPWHTHMECQFTNIYFLELPNNTYKTEIIGLSGERIEYEAKEGDILTLPSFLMHCSKPNTNKRKTIISFNTSYGLL